MPEARHTSFHCFKAGAWYACIWAVGFACLLGLVGSTLLDVSYVILIGSLAAVAVVIPVWRDAALRNLASVFFLTLGAALVSVVLALLPAVAFLLYLFLGVSPNHR